MSLVAPVLSISPDVQIAETVGELSASAFERGLHSVVLTGSLARGEGTWLQVRERNQLAGDAEFLLVLEEHAALPSRESIARLKDAIEARLLAAGLNARIELSPVHPNYLHSLRPHIFAYELVTHGKVVRGDARILNLAPTFSREDIPLEDGFRLLVNRMIELLEAVCESEDGTPITNTMRYCATKLWLDMATSFLLFEGRYEPSYRARAARIAELAPASRADPIPFSRFAERVSVATGYKLGESDRLPTDTSADLTGLIEDAHSLWRWELERLTGKSTGVSDDELLCRWISDQEIIARVRGWASVAKRYGALGALGRLPRWIGRALNGSPRRLIYAAGSELFFALPTLLGTDGEPKSRWARCWKLPIADSKASASISDWRRLGRAIARDYHQFLQPTRS